MKTLVLLTSQFPFGTSESFIASEYPFLSQSFKRVIIISQNVTWEKMRVTSDNTVIYRYNPSTSVSGFLCLPILTFSNFLTIVNLIKEEISFRKISGNRIKTRNVTILLKKIIKALQLRNFIRRTLSKESISESIVFYSYWLKTGAHAIALLDYRNSIKIARAHGSDIYEEKTVTGYLPLLRFSGINLNAIFFASKDGKEYFKQKTKINNLNFFVSYLGVTKPDFQITNAQNSNRYTIVSCSNMIPLKRIDLIISALAIVKSAREIEWLHFGDGILRKELEKTAFTKLGSAKGITYRFMGYYPNEELIKFYSANRIDLFINTSSTEGLPVSIIEAQSFGIPVIATDIGGVKEVVTTGTGSLMPVYFLPGDLAQLIEHYSNLSELQYDVIRENAIRNWDSKFNAVSNYKDFIQKVSTIFASEKDLTQQY
jgi:glycosyltransferase involved in cell wall biosynthesis